MTQANARHHLSILKEQGLIKVIGLRSMPGRGRPAKIFSLSDHLMGDNLNLLASTLLEITAATGQKFPEALSNQMAQKMRENARIDENPTEKPERGFVLQHEAHPRNLTQSLNRLTMILNSQHYHSRWEAHIEAPRLILGHCPYEAIIKEHPELCQMDAGIIQQMLGVSIEQTAKMSKDASGLTQCVFRIGKQRL
jgi:predicted ArsR family transcriptional regulator